ncbi:MAG: hypothetical protein OZ948_02510 [Deltaproteobacteria bacterium]|nr:hypothetical protein [Deltaproteobacteria bacterium]
MRLGSRGGVFVFAAALLAAPLSGCDTAPVRVRLTHFGSGNVDGLWFWRLQGGTYQRVCRIDLSDPYVSGGAEVVDYRQTCLDGRSSSAPWQAAVERVGSQTVELRLTYRRAGTLAAHRASAFNQHGESALSSASLSL